MGFLPDRSKVVIRHILERHAENIPDKECVVFPDGERWTYSKALEEAYGAADVLSGLGIRRNENVLIFLPNGKEWLRAWWGAAALGAVIVPVNTAYKGGMLKHICQDSGARHMIVTPDLAERLQGLNQDLNVIDPDMLSQGMMVEPKTDAPIEPWDIHGIMYTSGTTGLSKGVITPYLQSYTQCIHYVQATQEDTSLVDLPLFHASGMNIAYATWSPGGRVVLQEVFSKSRYLDIVREFGVTFALMIGPMASFLLSNPPSPQDADSPLRRVGIAPMVADPEAFMARFGIKELVNSYSSSEVSNTLQTENGPILNSKTCGKPRSGIQVRLVDEHDIPVPVGKTGELIVRSHLPWEMNVGYWNRPEETATAWRNGWFHTGDLFYCDEEGNYFFADRKKDAIRRRGENISSMEVEREVLAHPEVLEAAAMAVPSEVGEDEVKVFVVVREGAGFDPAELIRFLIPRMPYFMVPRFVEVLPDLPKTATMRVKKYELKALGNSAATWDRETAGIRVTRKS